MTEVRFTIPAVPVPQPRQRHKIATAAGGRQFVANYTPRDSAVVSFKATARQACAAAYSGPPLEGPVLLEVVAVFPRPKALVWKKRPMPRARHAVKPDRDNVEKALLDALRGLLFRDDAQVCAGEVAKWVAAGDEAPHVEVLCRTLVQAPAPAPADEAPLFPEET